MKTKPKSTQKPAKKPTEKASPPSELLEARHEMTRLKRELDDLRTRRSKEFTERMQAERRFNENAAAGDQEIKEARVAARIASECEQEWRSKLETAQRDVRTLELLLHAEKSKTPWQRIKEALVDLFGAPGTAAV